MLEYHQSFSGSNKEEPIKESNNNNNNNNNNNKILFILRVLHVKYVHGRITSLK